MDKFEKIINILGIVIVIAMSIFIIFFIIEIKEMFNDHRCYQLPYSEFKQDKKCERYWGLRNENN